MTDACPTSTPSDTNVRLVKDDGCSKPVDVTYYKSILGSLLYAAMGSRPDIAHAVAAGAKFSSAQTELHLIIVNQVLWYLRETQNLFLHYSPGAGELISLVMLLGLGIATIGNLQPGIYTCSRVPLSAG